MNKVNEPSKNSEFLNDFKKLFEFRSFHRINLFRNHIFHNKIVDFSFQVSLITRNKKKKSIEKVASNGSRQPLKSNKIISKNIQFSPIVFCVSKV